MTDWIAIDWGTSQLRVWRIGPDGTMKDHRTSQAGMGQLAQDAFEPTLIELIDDWLVEGRQTRTIACGMVGARQGWIEAQYASVPCSPSKASVTHAPVSDPRLNVAILSGLSQITPAPDVMRGEETQISGYLTKHPHFDGVICLPGTHTKWAHVSAGEVISFQTTLTGELFSLLSQHSVLRHSVAGSDLDMSAFSEGIEACLSRPENIATYLFRIRAQDLLADQDPVTARGHLSGVLIGTELAATKPYWLGQHVVLVGEEELCDLYANALGAQGVTYETANVTEMTLAGLSAAYLHQIGAHK